MPITNNKPIPHFNLTIVDLRNSAHFYAISFVHEFTSIGEIKRKLLTEMENIGDISYIQLFHPNNPAIATSMELRNDVTLHDLRIIDCGGRLEMSISTGWQKRHDSESDDDLMFRPSIEGTSGVYFGQSGVFKPADEEQGMPNNSKGYSKSSLRANFKPGQGSVRELAAYCLDYKHFCGVPETKMCVIEDNTFHYASANRKYPKLGSLQNFVKDTEAIENYGSSMFSDLAIQKIALLDLRLLNCDRNDGNILVVKHTKELVPIDHGYCLPAQLQLSTDDWAWYHYPQTKKPVCPEIVQYVQQLNVDELVDQLCEQVSVSLDCIFLIKLAHYVVCRGIHAGLTLFDLANVFARSFDEPDKPSPLEMIVKQAESSAYDTIDARSGRLSSHMTSSSSSSSVAAHVTVTAAPKMLETVGSSNSLLAMSGMPITRIETSPYPSTVSSLSFLTAASKTDLPLRATQRYSLVTPVATDDSDNHGLHLAKSWSPSSSSSPAASRGLRGAGAGLSSGLGRALASIAEEWGERSGDRWDISVNNSAETAAGSTGDMELEGLSRQSSHNSSGSDETARESNSSCTQELTPDSHTRSDNDQMMLGMQTDYGSVGGGSSYDAFIAESMMVQMTLSHDDDRSDRVHSSKQNDGNNTDDDDDDGPLDLSLDDEDNQTHQVVMCEVEEDQEHSDRPATTTDREVDDALRGDKSSLANCSGINVGSFMAIATSSDSLSAGAQITPTSAPASVASSLSSTLSNIAKSLSWTSPFHRFSPHAVMESKQGSFSSTNLLDQACGVGTKSVSSTPIPVMCTSRANTPATCDSNCSSLDHHNNNSSSNHFMQQLSTSPTRVVLGQLPPAHAQLPQPPAIRRMVSYSAPGSSSMFEHASPYEEARHKNLAQVVGTPAGFGNGCRMPTKLWRQQNVQTSPEFQALRLQYAEIAVTLHLTKKSASVSGQSINNNYLNSNSHSFVVNTSATRAYAMMDTSADMSARVVAVTAGGDRA